MTNKKLIILVVLVAAVVGGTTAAVFRGKTETIVKNTITEVKKEVTENAGGIYNTLQSVFKDGLVLDEIGLKVKKIFVGDGAYTAYYKNRSGKIQRIQFLLSTVATSSGASVYASSTMAVDVYVSSSTVFTATDYTKQAFSTLATSTVDQFILNDHQISTSTLSLTNIISAGNYRGTTTIGRFPDGATTTPPADWIDLPPDYFVRVHVRAKGAFCDPTSNAARNDIRWCEPATSTNRGFNLEGRLLILE